MQQDWFLACEGLVEVLEVLHLHHSLRAGVSALSGPHLHLVFLGCQHIGILVAFRDMRDMAPLVCRYDSESGERLSV